MDHITNNTHLKIQNAKNIKNVNFHLEFRFIKKTAISLIIV